MREGKCQPPMHGQRPSGGVSAAAKPEKKNFPATGSTGNGVLVIHPIRHARPPHALERQDRVRRSGGGAVDIAPSSDETLSLLARRRNECHEPLPGVPR